MRPSPLIVAVCAVVAGAGCDSAKLSRDAAASAECRSDDDCSDGVFCNGAERCLGPAADAGVDTRGCAPAAEEACPAPSVCDEVRHCLVACDGPRDEDGDGAERIDCGGDDCDDTRAFVHPTEAESCDGLDNDCDGTVDEGVLQPFYRDDDGDDFGVTSDVVEACAAPAGYSSAPGDCDDAERGINPGVAEVCDRIDNDCDGNIDIRMGVSCPCTDGETIPCGTDTGECVAGSVVCTAGAWGACLGGVTPSAERCDGRDNDCDGVADEAVRQTFYRDADDDGFGVAGDSVEACAAPDGYASAAGDCDDGAGAIHPEADELCDGIDNDCDGTTDVRVGMSCSCTDGETMPCGTSTGECVAGTIVCSAGAWGTECVGGIAGSAETCDGLDNDCDGAADDGVETCSSMLPVMATPCTVCSAIGGAVGATNDGDPSCGGRVPDCGAPGCAPRVGVRYGEGSNLALEWAGGYVGCVSSGACNPAAINPCLCTANTFALPRGRYELLATAAAPLGRCRWRIAVNGATVASADSASDVWISATAIFNVTAAAGTCESTLLQVWADDGTGLDTCNWSYAWSLTRVGDV